MFFETYQQGRSSYHIPFLPHKYSTSYSTCQHDSSNHEQGHTRPLDFPSKKKRTLEICIFSFELVLFCWYNNCPRGFDLKIYNIFRNWQYKDVCRKTIENQVSILSTNYYLSVYHVHFKNKLFSHWSSFATVDWSLKKITILNFGICICVIRYISCAWFYSTGLGSNLIE